MESFLRTLATKKVGEVPAYVQPYLAPSNLSTQFNKWAAGYKKECLDKGSITPLLHASIGVFLFSYAFNWPAMRRHMKAAEEAKLTGKPAHH